MNNRSSRVVWWERRLRLNTDELKLWLGQQIKKGMDESGSGGIKDKKKEKVEVQ
jgi:hypothetical protein